VKSPLLELGHDPVAPTITDLRAAAKEAMAKYFAAEIDASVLNSLISKEIFNYEGN
jgi:hypothetical protein